MKARHLLLAIALAAVGAAAQPQAPACPGPSDVALAHMLGFWRAEIEGMTAGTLMLERHPEYPQSFRGAINRNGERAQVAGDMEDGEFTLEESQDGVRIGATWLGDVAEGSCGREIRGTWQAEGQRRAKPFVLRKM